MFEVGNEYILIYKKINQEKFYIFSVKYELVLLYYL